MVGWFEVRVDGTGRRHYRLFCKLNYSAEGVDKPLLVVVDGRDKPFRTELAEREYRGSGAHPHSTQLYERMFAPPGRLEPQC